jgi:BirA family biotin operon repressor/biotin-[acetyl-CoA-carboxylase] ligase
MSKNPEEWRLPTQHLGHRVLVFDRLESTNSFAAGLAPDPENNGLVILAREQTAGRGQHGRTWECPPESGVLMSLLLWPPPALKRPALLTAWAAVSVCETIRIATDLQAKIKWPNDVLVRGKKVCGILIEQGQGTVVGIGLNIHQSADSLALAGLPLAGSLACFVDPPPAPADVFRLLVQQLDEEYDRLLRGDSAGLESCWKWRLGLLGKNVAVECLDGIRRGRLRDLTFDALELETSPGQVWRVVPENVRHVEGVSG